MEIAEVRDRESLKAYLNALRGQTQLMTARRVAFRGAARGLPLELFRLDRMNADKRAITPLTAFGALANAAIAATWPIPNFDRNAASSVAKLSYYATACGAAANVAHAAPAHAADAAAFAAADACSTDTGDVLWEALRRDLWHFSNNAKCNMPALWQDEQPPDNLSRQWTHAKRQMESDSLSQWHFWIHWYERVREGREFHADRIAAILNPLREDEWRKGPAYINPLFDDLLAFYCEEDELDALRAQATALVADRPKETTIASIARRSHNMPPELIDETIIVHTIDVIWEQVAETRTELEKPNPEKSRLHALATSMLEGMRAVAVYLGDKCDVFLEEAMKSGGRWAGPAIFAALVSPSLIEFVRKLFTFAGMP